MGPDGGLRRLLRLHTIEEERNELACCRQARKSSKKTKEKLQMTKTDQDAHLPVICTSAKLTPPNQVHAVRPSRNTGGSEEKISAEKKGEEASTCAPESQSE